jgi:hypothetical protein
MSVVSGHLDCNAIVFGKKEKNGNWTKCRVVSVHFVYGGWYQKLV